MTTLQALKILKTEFEDLNTPQKDGSLKSLMQLEDVLIQIVKELKPEVEIFVNAQKRKDTRTVEQMYIENLRKEKHKNKSIPRKETSQIFAQKKPLTRSGIKNISFFLN